MSGRENITLTGRGTMRGRNGWVSAAQADVDTGIPRGMVTVDLYSTKIGRSAPVTLRLDPADARALGMALLDGAAEAGLDTAAGLV